LNENAEIKPGMKAILVMWERSLSFSGGWLKYRQSGNFAADRLNFAETIARLVRCAKMLRVVH
jgi:hypothetical protein